MYDVNDEYSFHCDTYEHIDPNIEYILENQIYECDENEETEDFDELENELKYGVSKFCNCRDDESCAELITCFHGSNYIPKQNAVTNKTVLLLNSDRPCLDLIYECSSLCPCPPSCYNRVLQHGPCKTLKIIRVEKGSVDQFGLTTSEPLECGRFICEYIGEILTKQEAERRCILNEKFHKMNYIICLNEMAIGGVGNIIQTFIDPSRKGNIGRYLNHSCDPNCEILSIRVDSVVPKLGIFAKRDIIAGEELCFDYGHDGSIERDLERKFDRKLCYCDTIVCRKYLPDYNY